MSSRSRAYRLGAFAAVIALTATACGDDTESGDASASGECSPDVLSGETINFVIPFSPGGGFDAYARLIAPYLEEELGATVVPENQEGAGGLLAINNLIPADPDGTTIAIMNGTGAAAAAIGEDEGVQFALDELTYLGVFESLGYLQVVGRTAPFQSWEDVQAADNVRIGATGFGASDYINAYVWDQLFDLNAEYITGFAGSSELALAVTRADVDMMDADYNSDLPNLSSGDHIPVLTTAYEPLPDFPDVPLVLDQDLTEDQTQIAEAQLNLSVNFSRPLVAPPGMDECVRDVLRDAVAAVAENPEFVADAEGAGRPAVFTDGEGTDQIVQDLLNGPEDWLQMVRESYSA